MRADERSQRIRRGLRSLSRFEEALAQFYVRQRFGVGAGFLHLIQVLNETRLVPQFEPAEGGVVLGDGGKCSWAARGIFQVRGRLFISSGLKKQLPFENVYSP